MPRQTKAALLGRIDGLERALRFALENGLSAYFGGLQDGGCGCCSRPVDLDAEAPAAAVPEIRRALEVLNG